MTSSPVDVRSALRDLDTKCWALTTLGAALDAGLLDELTEPRTGPWIAARCGVSAELVGRMLDVLVEASLLRRDGDAYVAVSGMTSALTGAERVAFESDLRSTLLQSRDFFANARAQTLSRGWRFTDPDILEAQGNLSGTFADAIVHKLAPHMPGLAERFAAPTASFLDVGTGVGRILVEMCRLVPTLRAVGLEPFEAPASIARRNIAASGFGDRIELRVQRAEELTDRNAFDLVWVPAPFLPRDVLARAFATAHAALRAGGWVISGAYLPSEDLGGAVLRLRTVLYGGDALIPDHILAMLVDAGFVSGKVLPAPPTVPARMIVGQKRE
jgi:SAM-dependent methyltransferase